MHVPPRNMATSAPPLTCSDDRCCRNVIATMTDPDGPGAVPGGIASPRMVLLVTSPAAFLSSLDLFIVNIAFPAIRADPAGTDLGDLS